MLFVAPFVIALDVRERGRGGERGEKRNEDKKKKKLPAQLFDLSSAEIVHV